MKLEPWGYCSKTGICFNPFGTKPLWVQRAAEKIRKQHILVTADPAPF